MAVPSAVAHLGRVQGAEAVVARYGVVERKAVDSAAVRLRAARAALEGGRIVATDDVIETPRVSCAGPGCDQRDVVWWPMPPGWLTLNEVGNALHSVRLFCSLPCLIRWAGEQR